MEKISDGVNQFLGFPPGTFDLQIDGKTFFHITKDGRTLNSGRHWYIGSHVEGGTIVTAYNGDTGMSKVFSDGNLKSPKIQRAIKKQAKKCSEIADGEHEEFRDGLVTFILNKTKMTPGCNPYLLRKKIPPFDAREATESCQELGIPAGCLLVEIISADRRLTGAEIIRPDGSKKTLRRSKKKGNFGSVNGDFETAGKIFLSEGFSTAASIATEFPDDCSLCAFSAGNLIPVLENIRKTISTHITICGDNDPSGVGQKFAEKAAAGIINTTAIICPEAGDFNDYISNHGQGSFRALAHPPKATAVVEHVTWVVSKTGIPKLVPDHESLTRYCFEKYGLRYFHKQGQHYVANSGFWEKTTEDYVSGFALRHFLHPTTGKKISNTALCKEFVSMVKIINSENSTPETGSVTEFLESSSTPESVNFSNGVLDLKSETLSPFDHRIHRHDYIMDCDYSPGPCPTWDLLLDRIFTGNGKAASIFQEFIGLAIIGGRQPRHNQFLILIGSGNNGKTTLLNGIRSIFGKANHTSQDMGSINRFTYSFLERSRLNIFDDVDGRTIFSQPEKIKQLSGDSSVTVEQKHGISYPTFMRFKMIFSCNTIPKLGDDSEGFGRRMLCLPCNQDFGRNPKLLIPDVFRKLEKEKNGFAAKCISDFKNLTNRGHFQLYNYRKNIRREMLMEGDSMRLFIKTHVSITGNPDDWVSCELFLEKYCDDMGHGREQKSWIMRRFWAIIQSDNLDHKIIATRKFKSGNRSWGISGILMR